MPVLHLAAPPGAPRQTVREAWGDLVDPREDLGDDPSFGNPWLACHTAIADRAEGKFGHLYQTERDLAELRAGSRNLSRASGLKDGVLDLLANYVLGPGFRFVVHSDDPDLARAVQQLVDEFLDENDFSCGLDREIHHRSREDGEAFVVVETRSRPGRNAPGVVCRVVEPDEITEPGDPGALEEWLGLHETMASSWSFGVHTPAAATDEALGYHATFDPAGRAWDYLPAARVEHVKRNVTRKAKRGVSDFAPVLADLRREVKLRRNTAEGAALQAAVAWILQAPPGSTPGQIDALGGGDVFMTFPAPVEGGIKYQKVQRYGEGTILRPSPGLQYLPGPMGAERNPNFLLVGQYVLRAVGVRWNMPEYMISGDASNANYASTLVAESPFVKAREADQRFYARHFRSLVWKALALYAAAGRLDRGWPDVERLCEIRVVPPAVAVRDPLALARAQELQMRMGILSGRTAAAQSGLDYDAERAQRDTHPRAARQPTTEPWHERHS